MENLVKNLVSIEEINNVVTLLKEGISVKKTSDAIDYMNNCDVYLILKKETNKIKYLENAEKVCKESGLPIKNWMTKRSTFNVALKNGLKFEDFTSQLQLIDANKAISKGTKKVQKNGKLVKDVKNSAKIQAEKIEIKAVNENEIIELIADADFKALMKAYLSKGWSKANLMKAIAITEKK
jgi:cellobiose-specific phosphotransferase system component IIB